MPKYKKQHFVPQFYLRNFSINNDGEYIFLLNKIFSKPKQVVIRDQCQKDYFYSNNEVIEKSFGIFESEHANMIAKIIKDSSLNLNDKEKQVLIKFAVFQKARTNFAGKQFESMSKLTFEKAIKPIAKIYAAKKGLTDLKIDEVQLQVPYPPTQALAISHGCHILLMDLSATLLVNRSNMPFVTSDNPIIYQNPAFDNLANNKMSGLAMEGFQVLFPVSPKHTLLFYDERYYVISKNKRNVTFISNNDEINQLNILQAINCDSNLYCNDFATINCSDLLKKMTGKKEEPKCELISSEMRENRRKEIYGIHVSKPPCEINLKFQRIIYPDHKEPKIRVRSEPKASITQP